MTAVAAITPSPYPTAGGEPMVWQCQVVPADVAAGTSERERCAVTEWGVDPGQPTPTATAPPGPVAAWDEGNVQAVGLAVALLVFVAAAGLTRSFARGAKA